MTKMMKFGLIIGQIEKIGGMEKQAVILAHELQKRGIEVILFVSSSRKSSKGSESLDLDSITCKYLYYSRYSKLLSARLLRYHCNHNNITHLIAFNVENAEIAVAAGVEGKIAMNVRGIKFSVDTRLAEKYRMTASGCDLLITNSLNTSDLLKQLNIADEGSIRVIHNGIDLPTGALSAKSKVVLYVGSIKDVKDPITFVRACHKVLNSDREVKIIMAGDGDMRPLIERYIADNGLAEHFTLLGEVPYENIPYRESAVFVNSSLRESSCNSLLEALSFGIPVVATDISGNSSILSGLSHHKLVPVSNSDDMAEAILSQLDARPDTRRTIFEESRKLIHDHYSVTKMADDYIQTLLSS